MLSILAIFCSRITGAYMRIKILVAAILVITSFTFGQSSSPYPLVTLHDINFMPDTATQWYPSPLAGDTVRVRGTVTVSPLIDPILNRTPILYFAAAWGCYIQEDDSSPWSGLNIYQADSTFKGTLFDLCDTAKTYEFTGFVSPYGAETELHLINNPVVLISSQSKRPDPVILTMDSCLNTDGSFNIKTRKYNGMYVEFVSDTNHLLIVKYPPGIVLKPFLVSDNKGRYLTTYYKSVFFRGPGILYTPPPEGANLTYIRGLLEGYQSSTGWIWEIVPIYPGDIGPVGIPTNVRTANIGAPISFSLMQNYPNPFNPSTLISYSIPRASNLKLIVLNILGQTVKVLENEFKSAGNYSVNFNAADLPSGIYFYRLEAGQFSQVKKMILVK